MPIDSNPNSITPKPEPDVNQWLKEAKQDPDAPYVGMYLTHNGIVRATPKKTVRSEDYDQAQAPTSKEVIAVDFSYDREGLEAALKEARTWEGVYYVRAWLNEGRVPVGGSLMYILIGADIRPRAIDALIRLVGHIKNELVNEIEVYRS